MKHRVTLLLLSALIGLPAIVTSGEPVVVVRDAWIREAPPNATNLAGYMVMESRSDKSQSLVKASAATFGKVTIHRTENKDGMARMKHQKKVDIAPHGSVTFKPGGYHLMLMKPKQSLHPGDRVPVDLVFGDGSQLSVIFEVRQGMPMKDSGHGMSHGSDHSPQ